MAREAIAFDQVRERRTMLGQARRAIYSHHQQTGNDRDVAETIHQKAPAFTDPGDQNSGDRWADDSCAIEHGRVQRNRIHQVFLTYHVHQERLPRRNIKSIHHAQQRRQHEDVPNADDACKREQCQDQRENHGRNLGSDHYALTVETVGNDAAQRGHQKHRDLAGESGGAQQQRRTGQAIDQP